MGETTTTDSGSQPTRIGRRGHVYRRARSPRGSGGLPTQRSPMRPQLPRPATLRTTPDTFSNRDLTSRFSYRYVAGWGEDGALDAVRDYAQTIDTIAKRVEDALHATQEPTADAAGEALAT